MNNSEKSIELLFEKVENYGKTTIELFKLNAIDKTADAVSSLAMQLIIFLAIGLFALSINIGIALWIGDLLGKTYYGFFIVAGFYAITVLVVYAYRTKLIKLPLYCIIIKQMLQQKKV
jgi:hypothetical protein